MPSYFVICQFVHQQIDLVLVLVFLVGCGGYYHFCGIYVLFSFTWVKLFDFLGALFIYYYKISFLYTLFDSRRKNTSLVFNHCMIGFDVLRELNLGRKVGVRYMSLFLGQIVITGLLWIWQQTFQKVVLEVKISFNIKLF